MPATSLTLNFDALLSTTLMKYAPTLADNIGKDNVLLFVLQRDGAYHTVEDIGERAAFPLRYGLGAFDAYEGYDQLDTTPIDGITTAFFDWRQASSPIAISGKEERQNRSEERIINLLDSKISQSEDGIREGFSKAFLQGDGPNSGAASIETAYVSPSNGASFIDPLGLLVKKDPTTSTSIGSINQSTNSWWQNQIKSSSATTYQLMRNELRTLYNLCSKGSGGRPDLHLCDRITYELYEASLEQLVALPSYQKVDMPFDTLGFRGKPVAWDEQMVDPQTPALNNDTKGVWYMLNTRHIEIQVDSSRNFVAGPFVKPENQDAKVAQVLWFGAAGVKNRRKQGVYFNIARTLS